jgi:ABC-type phosphate transport system permease subunit
LRARRGVTKLAHMLVGRFLGWLFLALALVMLVRDFLTWAQSGHLAFITMGELWNRVSPSTLQLAQPAIQRHIAAWLWEPVIVSILLQPAAVVFGVPGAVLAWLFRARTRRPAGAR